MRYNKKCLWCDSDYVQKRIDQIFCSKKCSNGFNNNASKLKRAPYKEVVDNLKTQESVLEKFYYKHKDEVFFDEAHFKDYDINVSNARKQYVDRNNKLTRIEFLHYALVRVSDNNFKLIKL